MSAMPTDPYAAPMPGMAHGNMTTVGVVDHDRNGFDPTTMLTEWETGLTDLLPDGRTLRTFEDAAIDREIEIAPGIDLERDVLAHMDFVPLMRDVKVMDAALFQPVWGRLKELVQQAG